MYRYSKSTVTLPDLPIFGLSGPPKIGESDMSDSPDFYNSEIRDYRFADFCVHTARLSGNRLQKVGLLEKIGQWDHGIKKYTSNKPDCLLVREVLKAENDLFMI